MGFLGQWLWYLAAFLVGSAVAWAITVATVKPTSRQEALAEFPAGLREIGAR